MTSKTKPASFDAEDVMRRRAAAVEAARALGDRTVTVTVDLPAEHRGPATQFEMTGYAAARLIAEMTEPTAKASPGASRRPGPALAEALAQSESIQPRFASLEELRNVFESQGRGSK